MKRLLPIVVTMLVAFALILSGNSSASAKSKPAPADSTLVPNVSIWVGKDYNSDNYVVYVSHYVGMEDTPYGSYPKYESCAPEVCGTVVITTGKKPTVTLSKLASETVVSGNKGYATADYSQSHNLSWDGSSIPLSKKFRDSGKPVVNTLQYATISLNKAGDPVPPVYTPPCCK